jgi:hypothetical protein
MLGSLVSPSLGPFSRSRPNSLSALPRTARCPSAASICPSGLTIASGLFVLVLDDDIDMITVLFKQWLGPTTGYILIQQTLSNILTLFREDPCDVWFRHSGFPRLWPQIRQKLLINRRNDQGSSDMRGAGILCRPHEKKTKRELPLEWAL